MSTGRRGRDNGQPNHRIDVSLFGMSDTELLARVDDLADENGWTHTVDVRMAIGEKPEEADYRSRSGVGPRLSWMLRYGWLEHHTDDRSMWRLTAMGHAILDNPDLSRTIQTALAKLNPAQRLKLTREIAQSGATGAEEIKTALRREWQRNLYNRR
jgi:hypothetical protein